MAIPSCHMCGAGLINPRNAYCDQCIEMMRFQASIMRNANYIYGSKRSYEVWDNVTQTLKPVNVFQDDKAYRESIKAQAKAKRLFEENQNKRISEFYPHSLADFDEILNHEYDHVSIYGWYYQTIYGGHNMSTATVIHDPTIGTYDVTFKAKNFDDIKNAVAFIKTFVPASDRSYNKLTKTWTIDEKHWAICEAAFKQYFSINVAEKPKPKYAPEDFFYNNAPVSTAPTREIIAAKLEVMLSVKVSELTIDELKKAYRRKALELHPDRNNGDGSKMSELNAAWTVFNQ